MMFRPIKAINWKASEWKWRARRARRRAQRAALKLDGLFPLSFVPESSGSRRAV